MNERKNIERFFQEKFKNFEASPPDHLWADIEKSLNKKSKKTKVIPLWWKIAGAAALLAGILWSGSLIFSPNDPNQIQKVTETEAIENTPVDTLPQQSVVETDDQEDQINNTTTDSNTNKNSSNPFKPNLKTQQIANKPGLESKTKGNHPAKENIELDQNQAIVQTNMEDNNSSVSGNELDDKQQIETKNNTDSNLSQEALAQNEVKPKDTTNNTDKPSLLDVVEEMEKSKQEALASNDEDKKDLRWSVRPNVAPVYYNSLSQGSPLSRQFAENSKQGDISISFGVNIAYQISKRLSVRSGINSVDMGYATDGIEFGPAVSSTQQHKLNVRFNSPSTAQQPNIALSDGKTPLYTPDSELQARSEKSYQGSINQQFGYLEVPLELKYRLIDSKVGVNIIGGFSSLFLTDNKVTISSDNNLQSEVGEASNLNDTSFSTNIGIGVDYKFSEKLLFNLEPMFKYQMGTFSSDDGGFSPYMLGVYTGLSFSF